ncbi:hypothetical protein [Microbacterium indicum]|uniref:hypothetical protein n=1 Tax=Microbacterium indicum TaxID=358100 RepID=UPI00041DA0DF|nr:hypothetical protein [Microbacterium indicum]
MSSVLTVSEAPTRSGARVSFPSLLRAEWISLSSVRGNVAALIIGVALTILPGAAFALIYAIQFRDAGIDASAAAGIVPTVPAMGLNGLICAVAVAVVVGAAAYAKEHATGSLRTQLAASPRRLAMLSAKVAVVGSAIFVAALVAFLLTFAIVAGLYVAFGIPAEFGSFGLEVAAPILGAALATTLVGLFSLGAAALLRSETWAVTLTFVFLFVLPIILMQMPWEWAAQLSDALFGTTVMNLTATGAGFTSEYLTDLVLSVAWAGVALAGGAAVLTRRDA